MTSKNNIVAMMGEPLPLGVTIKGKQIDFSISVEEAKECKLVLYEKGTQYIFMEIPMYRDKFCPHIFTLSLKHFDYKKYEYIYMCDNNIFLDPYARQIIGRDEFGIKCDKEHLRCGFGDTSYQWKCSDKVNHSFSDLILYKLHVRGFTKHPSSKVKKKGTYEGIIEKIPYLKELGINSILLLPIVDYNEIIENEIPLKNIRYAPIEKIEQPVKINYWGFTKDAQYFAPKTSYAADQNNPCKELKKMVDACHSNDIEVLMEFYFTPGISSSFILDCLRFWVMEYHIDGFKIDTNIVSESLVVKDPILQSVKLLGDYWNVTELCNNNQVAEFNNGFLTDIRKYLKGDEGQIENVISRFKKVPKDQGVINYIANHDGFTLADLFSYDVKHNESNGENNKDGTEFNFSWNCGFEGSTRRKKVLELRKKQIKNALIMLYLSQGSPLLLAGDEFGQTQLGNNNAYCQDNEITWLNWNLRRRNKEILNFVKQLINLRKKHPVLHPEEEVRSMDYLSFGTPDFSVHGEKAWSIDYSNYNRVMGIMLSGDYKLINKKQKDNYFFFAFNMHWEDHVFYLPTLPKGQRWEVLLDSNEENLLDKKSDVHTIAVKDRTIVVLIGREISE